MSAVMSGPGQRLSQSRLPALPALPPWAVLLAWQLVIALGYWIAGRLGLLLAIPPGYATAVWPASGLALAAVILLGWRAAAGILAGSFLANIGTGFESASWSTLLRSLGVPLLIAGGAAAQALLGSWLIQRFVGYRNLLTQEVEVAFILLLGGPLACLVSASVGISTLWATGVIAGDAVLASWGTWWIGDSIGVLIFTPLVLVWARPPDRVWLRRQLWATLPLLTLFALVVAAFVQTSQREAQAIEQKLQLDAAQFLAQAQADVAGAVSAVQSVRGLYESSDEVTLAEFRHFSVLTQVQAPGLLLLSWAPLVMPEQRSAFEARTQVAIRDLPVPDATAARGPHAPVMAESAPYGEGDRAGPGYDLYSEPVRAQTLERVVATQRPSLSDPLRLLRDPPGVESLMIAVPVYATSAEGGSALRGFASGVVRAGELLAMPLQRLEAGGVRLRLAFGAQGEGAVMYATAGWRLPVQGDLVWSRTFELLGRSCRADFALPAEWLVAHRSLAVWTALTAGMLFTGLFGIFVLVIIGRTSRIAQLVEERTADLAREMARAGRLEQAARQQAEKLAASNRDLEQFAYVASHDLQAPLRTIASFAGLLESRCAQALDVKGQDFLEAIVDGAQEMKSRIQDLLQLSRVNSERVQMEPVHLDDVLRSVCRLLHKDIADSGAQIDNSPLPQVLGDRLLLEQLFQNLISNAIKFQKGGQRPRITLHARAAEGNWRIVVRDNGIGISKASMREMFVMFRRLHPGDKYSGTGIGLAICKKIVDLHHGSIEVESQVGEGSSFIITLPMKAARALG